MLAHSTREAEKRVDGEEMSPVEGAAAVLRQVDARTEFDGQSDTGPEHVGAAEGKLDCGRDSHVAALVVPSAAQLGVGMSIEAPLRCKEWSQIRAARLSLSISLS